MEEKKKGGAPIGNKNAETITIDVAVNLLNEAYDIISEDCYFLSSVAEACGTYRRQFEYVAEKFKDNDVVFATVKRIYNKCESIVMEKTAKGEIVPALGIFVLKSYHGLMESSRQHIDHTTKGESINTLTKEEAIKRSNELDDEY